MEEVEEEVVVVFEKEVVLKFVNLGEEEKMEEVEVYELSSSLSSLLSSLS